MATAQPNYWPTLYTISKGLDNNGKLAAVGEVLNEKNEILDDIPWQVCNSTASHKLSLRENIPAPTWRQFNQGIYPSVSTTGQIEEVCGMMANYSEVDKALADLNGNTSDYKLKQATPIIEGFNQDLASTLVDGDYATDKAKFNGLSARYYGLTSSTGGTTYENVIDAEGTNADVQTSIYLVGWSPNTVYGIYPKGSVAGLKMDDRGQVTISPTTGGQFEGYRTYFEWQCGLAIEDWRYVVRIANIDFTKLQQAGDATDNSANLMKYMSLALDIPPSSGNVRWAFYCHKKVRSYLRVQLMNKSNTWLTLENITNGQGITRPTLSFMGVPIRRVDKMSLTEAILD